jgi:hypothetical protein
MTGEAAWAVREWKMRILCGLGVAAVKYDLRNEGSRHKFRASRGAMVRG